MGCGVRSGDHGGSVESVRKPKRPAKKSRNGPAREEAVGIMGYRETLATGRFQ